VARYLVTGAAGFIGSKVAELLLRDGHIVVGVDNLNDAYAASLKEWRLARLEPHPAFAFHRLDIRAKESLRGVFEGGFDGVINLAARAGVRYSVIDPDVYISTNVAGTLNLLELCREHGVKKFVLASTSSLYGADNPVPFSEQQNTDRPLSPYAASKKAAEAMCYAYHHLHHLDISVLRYFTVYGPAGRPDMAPFRFVQWIIEGMPLTLYGDGTQSRDFTFVDDIARGTIAALRPVGYRIINLGGDGPHSVNDLIATIERLTGRRAIIEHKAVHSADAPRTWADITVARELLGWSPTVSLEEGVRALVDWYLENRAWASTVSTADVPATREEPLREIASGRS
jgi:UDP-glucuronate 4-epimerase